ncbi:MAG: Z-ring associated protein ZapG [Plesiomonas sp.]|uniref:Z-ring associated protein ZapG n=1 Tax=Plesiomonas sp. TaxID=2486279 RepID=UPI003F2FE701
MTWISALIFILGLALGMILARFTQKDLRKQKKIQTELEKNKYELEQYRQELTDHFAHSAELLDNMANDYRKLYQHMAKTSNQLLPEMPKQDNPFRYRLTEADNDQAPIDMPRDYPDQHTGIFNPKKPQA